MTLNGTKALLIRLMSLIIGWFVRPLTLLRRYLGRPALYTTNSRNTFVRRYGLGDVEVRVRVGVVRSYVRSAESSKQ